MKKFITTCMLLASIMMIVSGCSSKEEKDVKQSSQKDVSTIMQGRAGFEVTSESVDSSGNLKTECCAVTAAPKGDNLSPQLSWNPVEGANSYAIYMFDSDADNFLHWRLADIKETTLDEGAVSIEKMYVGPYPPEGTHNYQIVVYALKDSPKIYEGKINSPADVKAIEKNLDEIDGQSGNVIAIGVLNFKVTRGE